MAGLRSKDTAVAVLAMCPLLALRITDARPLQSSECLLLGLGRGWEPKLSLRDPERAKGMLDTPCSRPSVSFTTAPSRPSMAPELNS